MFDKFESYKVVNMKQDMKFIPARYELWQRGQMTNSGLTISPVTIRSISDGEKEQYQVSFDDSSLRSEITTLNFFDIFVTSLDRLQLIIIPNATNSNNVALQMLKMNLGPTRNSKNFDYDEPFCCNLFFQQGQLVKVTFSFSNPEKLLELYIE